MLALCAKPRVPTAVGSRPPNRSPTDTVLPNRSKCARTSSLRASLQVHSESKSDGHTAVWRSECAHTHAMRRACFSASLGGRTCRLWPFQPCNTQPLRRHARGQVCSEDLDAHRRAREADVMGFWSVFGALESGGHCGCAVSCCDSNRSRSAAAACTHRAAPRTRLPHACLAQQQRLVASGGFKIHWLPASCARDLRAHQPPIARTDSCFRDVCCCFPCP